MMTDSAYRRLEVALAETRAELVRAIVENDDLRIGYQNAHENREEFLTKLEASRAEAERLRTLISSFVKQAEACGYECEGGPLTMNADYIALKAAALEGA